jgi:hypothetical protein
LALWKFWPSAEPSVAIPERVCKGKLPGPLIAGLLPKKGAAFKESAGADFETPERGTIPECRLYAGGQGVSIRYNHLGDSGLGIAKEWKAKNEQTANQSGFSPIRLGEASGYAGPQGAGLIIDCPGPTDKAAILLVDVEYLRSPNGGNADSRAKFATLAAEVSRVTAQDIMKCAGAEALPDGPPRVG